MLRRQGWEPGQLLGAQGASHAVLLSAASSAPIKVVLKDDTMGLGAKVRQKQSDECTGLNVFKDLLGRLNGKSEDIIKQEQQVRSELKTSLYVERKFGPMRFVKGGLLVGDHITDVLKKDDDVKKESDESAPRLEAASDSDETPAPKKEKKERKEKKEKRSKKRKANDSDSLNETDEKQEKRDKKKKKKSRDEAAVEAAAGAAEPAGADDDGKEKKSKKSKKSKSKSEEPTEADGEVKAKSKKSKKQKGDAGDTAEADEAKDAVLEGTDATKKKKKRKTQEPSDVEAEVEAVVTPADSTATPVDSGTSTPRVMSGRHYARSRNIASKKLAMADMAALNQVRAHGILTVPD